MPEPQQPPPPPKLRPSAHDNNNDKTKSTSLVPTSFIPRLPFPPPVPPAIVRPHDRHHQQPRLLALPAMPSSPSPSPPHSPRMTRAVLSPSLPMPILPKTPISIDTFPRSNMDAKAASAAAAAAAAKTKASAPTTPTSKPSRRASWAPKIETEMPDDQQQQHFSSSPRLLLPPASSPLSPSPSPTATPPPPPPPPPSRPLKTIKLHRGGTYVSTCVGPIQIGIPPETIKDCLNAGMPVPRHYIVPTQRFNRQLGRALGVNVCEFEFPAYYNFFFHRQSINLIVDSKEVEENIRVVFQETLFGPKAALADADADYAPDFPREQRPDLLKEALYFRKFGDIDLTIDMLLQFTHFDPTTGVAIVEQKEKEKTSATPHVRITKSPLHGGEYHIEEILPSAPPPAVQDQDQDQDQEEEKLQQQLPGRAVVSGIVQLRGDHSLRNSSSLSFSSSSSIFNTGTSSSSNNIYNPENQLFTPPRFGVTVLGSSHGFDSKASTSGYVLWINRRGIMIDPPPHSSSILEKNQIHPSMIDGVIVTHCHADHDAGTFQKLLCEKRITLYTTPTIYASFIRKYSALSGIDADFLRSTHKFRPVRIGGQDQKELMRLRGASFRFFYSLHSIPCIGMEVFFGDKSIVFSADHMNDPQRIQQMYEQGVLSLGRRDELLHFPWSHDLILHEAGVPPIHTPLATLEALDDSIKERLYLVHVSSSAVPASSGLRVAPVGVKNTLELSVDVPEYSEAISALHLIEDVHFLSNLSLVHARGLLEIGYKKRFAAGEVVVPEGSKLTEFCILSMGLLEVTYKDNNKDKERQLAGVGVGGDKHEEETKIEEDEEEKEEEEKRKRVLWSSGDYFGENVFFSTKTPAMQQHEQQQEEVRALTDVELIAFPGTELQYLLAADAYVYSPQQQQQRQRQQSPLLHSSSSPSPSPSPLRLLRLERLLTCNYTLNSLTRAQKVHLESLAQYRSVKAGEYVWKAGSVVDFSVLIEEGSLCYEGRAGVLMKSLGSLLYRSRSKSTGAGALMKSLGSLLHLSRHKATGGSGSSLSSAAPVSSSSSSSAAAAAAGTEENGFHGDAVIAQGEDATQSPCPLSFEKGNFVGPVAFSSSALSSSLSSSSSSAAATSASAPNSHSSSNHHTHHTQTCDLVALSDATVLVFRADLLKLFFQQNPGVLLCLLDAEFVL